MSTDTDIIKIINSGDLQFESVLSFFIKAYDDLKARKNLDKYKDISIKVKNQLLTNCINTVRTFVVNSDSEKSFKNAIVSLKTFEERGNFKYSGFGEVDVDVIEEDDRKPNYENNYNLNVYLINKNNNKKVLIDEVLSMNIVSAKGDFLHQENEIDNNKKLKYYINYSLSGFYVNGNNEFTDHLGMLYGLFDDLSKTTESNNIFEKHLKEKFYKIFLSKYRERDIFDTIDSLDIVRNPDGEYSKFFNPYDSPNGNTGNIGSRNILDTFKVKVGKHMYDDIKFYFEKVETYKNGKELYFYFRISSLLHTLPSDILYYKKLNGNTNDKIVLKETIKESIKTIKPYIQYKTSEGYVTVSFYSNSKYTGNYRVDDVNINDDFLNVKIKIGEEESEFLRKKCVYDSFKNGSNNNGGYCYFKFVDLKVGDNVLNTPIMSEILTHEVKNEAGKVISTFKDYDSIMYDKEICVEFNYNKLLLLTPDNDDTYYNKFVSENGETNYLLNIFEESKVGDASVTDKTPRALIGSYCDTSLLYKDGKIYLDCTNFGLHNCINFIDWIKILDIDYFDKYHWQEYFNQEYEFYTNGVVEQYSTEDGYLLFSDSSSVSNETLTVKNGSINGEILNVKNVEYVKDRSSNKNMYLVLEPANSEAKKFIEIGFNIYDLNYQTAASFDETLGTRQVIITSFLSQDANSWRAHRKVVS